MKLRSTRWVEPITYTGETRNEYMILVKELEEKKPF
jgi:hypothetical protein